jgi:drug/metabolite transporter (DMT)-like permease
VEEMAVASIQPRSVRITPGAALVAGLIIALWGTNPTVLKIVLRGFPPLGSAGVRFAIAALGVWAWCAITRVKSLPQRGEGHWLVINSALFIAQIATFTLGVFWGTAGHSIVILHIYPFLVVALAHFLLPGERATLGRVAGLMAAFSGIIVLFAGEFSHWQSAHLLGDGIQLLSAIVLAFQIVFLKHALARIEPSRVVLWQMVAAAVVFLAYGFAVEHLAGYHPGTASWVAMLYQGLVIGTFCFVIWLGQIRRYAASVIAIFGFIAPLVGVVMSALVLHEPLTPILLISCSLVALGIVVSNLW